MGRSQVQSSQARTLETEGHVYAVVPKAEHADQPDMQSTFYTCIFFFDALCSLLHLV